MGLYMKNVLHRLSIVSLVSCVSGVSNVSWVGVVSMVLHNIHFENRRISKKSLFSFLPGSFGRKKPTELVFNISFVEYTYL